MPDREALADMTEQSARLRGLDMAPGTVHEIITRQKVDALSEKVTDIKTELSSELGEVRMRINGLIFVVIAAVVVQVVLKAWGAL